MAIDLCSESSGLGMSPRISFSHDLCQTDTVPVEHCHPRSDASLLESTSDFDFCVTGRFEQESSSADELFSDGKILPIQITKTTLLPNQIHQSKPPPPTSLPPPHPRPPTAPNHECSKKESLKEILETTSSDFEDRPPSKSFWRFKRSTSLNCGNGHKRSLICSLPLLLRSNSTGSAQNPKRTPSSKDNQKQQHLQKQLPTTSTKSSSSTNSCSTTFPYSASRKPPLKKNLGGSYSNGIRINPVLNVPPPYISKGTANLFGWGSFFCSGKDKNKKK